MSLKKGVYFISTPIFYVNSVPHIGHLYSAVLADAVARWYRILGYDILYSTGTDEHGLKIQQAAANKRKNPRVYCDQISRRFKELFESANINYDHFIRTTDQRHIETVNHFWNVLYKNGYIYKGSYEGWYSTSDEAFLTEEQIIHTTSPNGDINKVSIESGQPVEWMKEDNYMFRLSEFGQRISKWLDTGVIKPSIFEKSVRSWISALPDLSISRQRDRLNWGIPVPKDDSQTIYVWLDALVNYLTVSGYPRKSNHWPADCHVVGKDILRFHAVYWPAFLMAAGLPPPKSILCHCHWLMDNVKMSKSRGNVVDPFDRLEKYTADGLRFFLLREGVPHSDGNYNDSKVVEYLNSELCNTLGNLLSRCTGSAINPDQIFPEFDAQLFSMRSGENEKQLLNQLKELPDLVDSYYRDFHIYKGLDAILAQLRLTNVFVQDQKPWELAKLTREKAQLNNVLHIAMENLRICGILLQPIVPNLTDRLLTRLGIPVQERNWGNTKTHAADNYDKNSFTGRKSIMLGSDRTILFPRIVEKKAKLYS